jgi:hypothetical protein
MRLDIVIIQRTTHKKCRRRKAKKARQSMLFLACFPWDGKKDTWLPHHPGQTDRITTLPYVCLMGGLVCGGSGGEDLDSSLLLELFEPDLDKYDTGTHSKSSLSSPILPTNNYPTSKRTLKVK